MNQPRIIKPPPSDLIQYVGVALAMSIALTSVLAVLVWRRCQRASHATTTEAPEPVVY